MLKVTAEKRGNGVVKRFLAVDDEPLALRDLKQALCSVMPESECVDFRTPQEVIEYVKTTVIDVAFLDIEMGNANGIVLAKRIKDIQPKVHIIFVTSHPQYAVEAFSVRATGYILKPVETEDIKRELTFIYGDTCVNSEKVIHVQTFGGFDVFVGEQRLTFKRAKAKELLAYLVDRRGNSITTREACAVLWEDSLYSSSQKNYLQNIVVELRATLREAGIEDIFIKSRNSLAIAPSLFQCDSYRFMDGDPVAINNYRHDYMPSYSWAEFTLGILERNTNT